MTLTDAHKQLFDAKNRLRCADKSQRVQRQKGVFMAMCQVLKAEMKEKSK